MVSVNRSVRYLLMVGSAILLAGGSSLSALADGDILPPPPPDEDTPKPPVFDITRYVQTYPIKKAGTTTMITTLPTRPVVTTTSVTTTTTQTTSSTGSTPTILPSPITTTTTVQATPAPASGSANVAFRPANAAAQALLNKAYDQMRKNVYYNAVKLLNEAVRADANSVVARRYLAYCLIRIGRPGEALNQLVILQNMIKPNLPTTFDTFNLGECYLSLRNFQAAQTAFKLVVAAEPKNDAARGDLIKSYAYDQKFPEAMQQLTIGQQNRDPGIQRYYRTLLELIYNAKTAGTIGNAPNVTAAPASETSGSWQQIAPK
jgi:Tfp pilus assembly protein PilF